MLKQLAPITPARSRLAAKWLLWAAAVAPAVLAFRIQIKNWINIPVWDEWDTPGGTLLQYAHHNLTWAALFAQHNEHRPVFPRLVNLLIASVAGWDARQGMVLGFLCAAVASGFVLRHLYLRSAVIGRGVLCVWLIVNLLLFAPSEYENFLTSLAFYIFIPVLCLLGCIEVNLSRWNLPAKVASNSLLALIATYSFAHGIILWPLAIPVPNKNQPGNSGRRLVLVGCYAAYGLSAMVSMACYFWRYAWPQAAPPSARISQLPQIIDFMTVWLGGVLRSDTLPPRLPGILVGMLLCAALALSLVFVYRNRASWKAYYPWFILTAFSLGTGLLIAIGRVNIGVDLVFNRWFDGYSGMKYNINAVFAYVAVIGLLWNLYRDWVRRLIQWRFRFVIILTVCLTSLSEAWARQFSEELTRVHWFQQNRRRARAAVIWANALPNNPEFFLAYPYAEGFSERIQTMRQAGLIKLPAVSDRLMRAISTLPESPGSQGGYLDLGVLQDNDHFRVAGWARNPSSNTSADYIVLGWADSDNAFHPFTAIPTGQTRFDLITAFNSPSLKNAGFDQEVNVAGLPKRPLAIRAWAVDFKRQEAFPLSGALQISRSAP